MYRLNLLMEVLPPPPFSIKELRDAIPAHLFKRSALKSSVYLVADLIGIAALFYAATFIDYTPLWLQLFLWPLYWLVQVKFAQDGVTK